MSAATVDELIIKIEVENDKALTAIDEVLAKLNSLDRAASADSLKNFTTLGETIKKFAEASEKMAKVDFSGIKALFKALEDIDAAKLASGTEIAADSIKKVAVSMKEVGEGGKRLADASMGISKLADALRKFTYSDYAVQADNVRKILMKLAPAVQEAGKSGTQLNNMRLAIENLGPALRTFGKAETYADAIKNIGITIKGLANAILPLKDAPVQELKNLADAVKKLGEVGADGSLASNMVHLAKGITTLVTVLSYGIKDSVAERFAKFAETVLPPLKILANALSQFTSMGVDENLGTKLSAAAGGIVTLINTLTSGVSPEGAAKFGDLAGALSGALKPLGSAMAQLQKLGSNPELGVNLTTAAQGIVGFIQTLANGASGNVLTQFTEVANAMGPAFKALTSGLRNISKVGADENFAASMNAAQEAVISFVNALNNGLSEEAVNRFARLANGIKAVGDASKRLSLGTAKRISEAVPSNSAIAKLNIFARKLTGVKTNFKTAGDAAKAFGRKMFAIPFASGTNAIKNLSRSISNLKSRIGRVVLLRLIRSAFVRITQAIRDGINALYQWATAYGNSFVGTMDSLATSFLYLRNSMAAAASPLIDALAPAINHVIDLLVNALNIFNQFIAAITGATTWRKAIKKNVSYGDSIGGIGDAASGAGRAAKEFEKQLMGFDEINNLTLPKDSGGGGGGGAGGTDFAGMFEEMDVSSGIADWVNDLKNAWQNNDWSFFEEIGRQIGTKVITGLQNINWDAIQTVAEKIGKATASVLNGVLQAEVDGVGIGEALGHALAEAYNTYWSLLDGFFDTFDFTLFGQRIIQGIVTFFEDIRWDKYSSTLSHMFTGMLDTLSGLLTGVDWSTIPKRVVAQIVEFFKGIDVKDIARAVAQLITSALLAVGGLITGISELVASINKKIIDYFKSYIDSGPYESVGLNIIHGIWTGITDAIANAATWLKNNLFKPICDGIKAAFGISSPAKQMLPIGENVVLGILEGAKAKVNDIVTWFKNLPKTIKDAIGNLEIVATIKGTIDKTFETAKAAFNALANSTAVKTISGIIGDTFNTIKSAYNAIVNGTATKTISGAIATAFNTAKDAFNALVSNTATKTISGAIADAFNNAKSAFNGLSSNTATKTISGSIAKAFNNAKDAFNGLKNDSATKTIKGDTAKSFKDTKKTYDSVKTGSVTKTINAKITGLTKALKKFFGLKAKGGLLAGSKWHPVTAYAGGGLPNAGQMFVARERGPELVGTINGNTAVMNNDQIVSSVSDGVYRAVMAAMAGSGGDVVIKVDSTVLGRAAINGINNVTRQQGRLMLDLG